MSFSVCKPYNLLCWKRFSQFIFIVFLTCSWALSNPHSSSWACYWLEVHTVYVVILGSWTGLMNVTVSLKTIHKRKTKLTVSACCCICNKWIYLLIWMSVMCFDRIMPYLCHVGWIVANVFAIKQVKKIAGHVRVLTSKVHGQHSTIYIQLITFNCWL